MVKGADPNPSSVTYGLRTVITRYSGIFDFERLQRIKEKKNKTKKI